MRRALSWLLGLPASILLIAFAVANRQWVTISFDPIDPADPALSLSLPLWFLAVAGMLVGLILGWALMLRPQARSRRVVKRQRAEIDRLAADNDRLRAALKSGANQLPPAPAPDLTSLPPAI